MVCLANIDNFCERVRVMLGSTESVAPDSLILSYEYSGIAKRYVDDKLSSYTFEEEFTDEQIELLNCCYICRTAIEIAPIISNENNIKLEQTTHSKTEYFKNSADDLLERLSEKFAYYFNLLTIDETIPQGFTTFAISNENLRYEGSDYNV